jgi:hypothetical protein
MVLVHVCPGDELCVSFVPHKQRNPFPERLYIKAGNFSMFMGSQGGIGVVYAII